ncbi:PRTRC system ThiF family protein [Mucilaginibacter gossypiicola]|uniref:PRTRC system ThiF family protein n=1 Tax=Mucilaginibacter gossypiicola TaxID=551995 RepID=A0A1H8LS85_9SPHI|nr:PRTRC system ThiF family protein [Mucilaginibacter gossypiicola]SEO07997.1 PRTRC system ThiF family protein [Mucilaginibacter gossypiicola]
MKKKKNTPKIPVHIVDNELLQPRNPVTVNLIGAGGTGSHVLTALARLNFMLNELGHPGLSVRLFDDDLIERNNRLRMLFTSEETGFYKAAVLTDRINRAFGTNWKAVTERYNYEIIKANPGLEMATITITCVDSVEARFQVAHILKDSREHSAHVRNSPRYWLDFGNSSSSGQVIIATVGEIKQPESQKFALRGSLPMVTDEFPDLLKAGEQKDRKHNCSTAAALEEQDLFVNASIAYPGVEILKKMFREGMLFERGFFYNLKEYKMQPLKVA